MCVTPINTNYIQASFEVRDGFALKDVMKESSAVHSFRFSEVPPEGLLVGRDYDCDFRLAGLGVDTVSRHHARIVVNPDRTSCSIVDAGATNGTVVEHRTASGVCPAERVPKLKAGADSQPVKLYDGDHIYLSGHLEGEHPRAVLGVGGAELEFTYVSRRVTI